MSSRDPRAWPLRPQGMFNSRFGYSDFADAVASQAYKACRNLDLTSFLSFPHTTIMALAPYADLLPRLSILLTDKLQTKLDSDERDELADALSRFRKMQVSSLNAFYHFPALTTPSRSINPTAAVFTPLSPAPGNGSFTRFLAPSIYTSHSLGMCIPTGTSPLVGTRYAPHLFFYYFPPHIYSSF